jgi:hypothetical protein
MEVQQYTTVATEVQQYIKFLLLLALTCQQYKSLSVAKQMEQWVPFALLSSYKIFCTDVNKNKYKIL